MGAIERNGYRFEPEYSVIEQNGAVHVFSRGQYIDEVHFSFNGQSPEQDQIEKLVEEYCQIRGI